MVTRQYHIFKVKSEDVGLRIDKLISVRFPQYSRNIIKRTIDSGDVTLNGKKIKPNSRPKENDTVDLRVTPYVSEPVLGEKIDFKIIEDNNDFLIIDKPPNLVVHPAPGNQSKTLVNGIINIHPNQVALPRAGLIHRIDKDTSGLLLVAKNFEYYQRLTDMMQKKQVMRYYFAIATGEIISGETIEQPISRHSTKRTKMQVNPNGKKAITHYRIAKRLRGHTVLDVQLDTGRTHQIRVHLSWKGFPIVGDKTYGWRPKLTSGMDELLKKTLQQFSRQALHAYKLNFSNPRDGKNLEFCSPPPKDFQELVKLFEQDKEKME